ncbi:MAG: iron-containing alcohol dehydrogenase [Oscillospiraceae bacterium]
MKDLVFENPVKIYFGNNARRKVGKTLEGRYHSALALIGKGIPGSFYTELVTDLKDSGIAVFETGEVDSNPRVSTVRAGAEICVNNKIDVVIALGGGSTMDCAKMIAVSAAMGIDVCDFLWGDPKPITASLPVVTIPTVAATGTELNNTAVIRNEFTKKKSSCAAECMYPQYSFIDPLVAEKLPKRIALWGAMDVLSHTYEYYFNGYYSPFQLRFSEGIMLAAMECIEQLAKDGFDSFNYGELMWTAAMTWGTGLTRIGRGAPDMACHTIEEGMGAYFDTHHGAGLGVITPVWMRYIYTKSPEIFARYARNIWKVEETDDTKAALAGIESLEEWMRKLGVERSYRQLTDKITDEQLKVLSDEIYSDNKGVVGRLVPLSGEDVYKILKLSSK